MGALAAIEIKLDACEIHRIPRMVRGDMITSMTNEAWQTASQIAIAIGIACSALGGFGAYFFGKRIDAAKDARSANVGKIIPKERVLLSADDRLWPKLEIGDSGSVLLYAGPAGKNLFSFADDTGLAVVSEDGQVKVSTIIRDSSGKVVAELIKNEWKVNPSNSFDRNYSADALEVRDPSGDVVLQVRALPDRVQLQAKLYDSSGLGFGLGKQLGPSGWAGVMEKTGPGQEKLTLHIEPMFEYPSETHHGQLRPRDGV